MDLFTRASLISKFSHVILPVALLSSLAGCGRAVAGPALEKIELPEGFVIELVTDEVPNARSMVWGNDRTLFVGTRSAGAVYAVDLANPGSPRVRKIATGLNMPNGVAFKDGALYVAEVERVTRFDDISDHLDNAPEPVVVARFPTERHHGWKYIAFGPDKKLYVPVGVPCNICDKSGYGHIERMNADGTEREIVANGVRNSVGFTWHPDDGALWFTDNGRDRLGNDIPPCELNRASESGLHFGFPYCHGRSIKDPEFGKDADCAKYVAPVQELGPHVAPLGVKFYTGSQFPVRYRNQIFIAEHGSWNRDEKIGYRITMVTLEGNGAVDYQPFAKGWLQGEKSWGRPVDLILDQDGSMLVSDDTVGAIYRISYRGT